MKEKWDVVDANGRPTGRVIEAGESMHSGEYHPAVSVWIRNSRGEFLISRRNENADAAPGMWETTSGSVISGETSIYAAMREVQEELGIGLDPACARHFMSYTWPQANGRGAVYYDVWLFSCGTEKPDVRLQPGETMDSTWARPDRIRKMIRDGIFVPYTYIEELFAFAK